MRSAKDEGTKIAAASKELNVASGTIRRYLSEFDIETTSDDNGVKVLPPNAMKELHEVRRLREEGMSNPQILEVLEGMRTQSGSERPKKQTGTTKKIAKSSREESDDEDNESEDSSKDSDEVEELVAKKDKVKDIRKLAARKKPKSSEVEASDSEEAATSEEPAKEEKEEEVSLELGQETKSKHSLNCQTCGKTFEHLNPKLRDCIDCFRAKRKERRRGNSERHKNVIQHPLAQQALNKSQQQQQQQTHVAPSAAILAATSASSTQVVKPSGTVRSYRKAIEETRHITSNLKRRLERPDLPESERRWLEQIYAYELILHQGWRHLAEYRAGTHSQKED